MSLEEPAPARPPPPSPQQEDTYPSDFSKIAEKVSKAIPWRYDDDESAASPPVIYVVPRELAEGRNKDAYESAAVCIGPLFNQTQRSTEPWRKLERYKWCCVRKLIINAEAGPGRQGAWIPDLHTPLLRKCLDRMTDLKPQIRASYYAAGSAVVHDYDGHTLALMMLLDGSFLLHCLLKRAGRRISTGDGHGDDDDWTQVFGQRGLWVLVARDLLLLKNQIPFFVLRVLFKLLKDDRVTDREDDLVQGGLRLFAWLRPGGGGLVASGRSSSSAMITCRDVHHLLHLFYMSIDISRPQQEHQHQEREMWVPCATELEDAGVAFLAKRSTATSFLDVSFRGGVLEIPPLELYDDSEALFRNLIAFEQTYPHMPVHVTAYAILMDCLIKTAEDMRLLQREGVLVSHMNGDRDVAAGFFSRACAQARIGSGESYLIFVMGDVVRYQSTRWPRYRAVLVRNYLSNPWVVTSLAATIFLLIMTVLQTYFTVYAYFKPPN